MDGIALNALFASISGQVVACVNGD